MYWISYTVAGKPRYESTGTHNKKLAQKILSIRLAEIAEGRWNLPSSNPPRFKLWTERFLRSIQNPSTKARYSFSIAHLLEFFGENTRLSDIASVRRIEEFKQERLETGVKPATVNRDLSVLRRMLTLATRQRLIARNPFDTVKLLEERKNRKQPRIVSYPEQEKLMAVATPHLRALIALICEAGLRINKEALPLKWADIDFEKGQLAVRESKTLAGRRFVPLSEFCTAELRHWRRLTGPEFSQFVFPNFKNSAKPLGSVRKTWSTALRNAGLNPFPIYSLRATFASRLSAAGVPDGFVSQLLGHAGGLLQTYSKAVDEYRRDAIHKLEQLREAHTVQHAVLEQVPTGRPN
jgi:integrase